MRAPLFALALTGIAGLASTEVQAQSGHSGHGATHAQPAARATAVSAAKPAGKFVHPADRNKDQRIDLTEWVDMGEPRSAFAKADKNRDGKLDGPEFVAAKYPGMSAPR
jgi:hypothetical protein